jgi:hypothetical protein
MTVVFSFQFPTVETAFEKRNTKTICYLDKFCRNQWRCKKKHSKFRCTIHCEHSKRNHLSKQYQMNKAEILVIDDEAPIRKL